MAALKTYSMTCDECGFTTHDEPLMRSHSCTVTQNGGRCEDWPCCGHEWGDCNGQLYGSSESIQEATWGHEYCDHEAGMYFCDGSDDDDDEGDDDDADTDSDC